MLYTDARAGLKGHKQPDDHYWPNRGEQHGERHHDDRGCVQILRSPDMAGSIRDLPVGAGQSRERKAQRDGEVDENRQQPHGARPRPDQIGPEMLANQEVITIPLDLPRDEACAFAELLKRTFLRRLLTTFQPEQEIFRRPRRSGCDVGRPPIGRDSICRRRFRTALRFVNGRPDRTPVCFR